MSLQYAVSRRSVGSHCTPGGVTPPLGINDRGVILSGESLTPLTPVLLLGGVKTRCAILRPLQERVGVGGVQQRIQIRCRETLL